MNLPNKITISRIGLAFLFIAAVSGRWYIAAGFVFIVAVITDAIDGELARKLGCVTDFGKLMDPIADKILISAAFISLSQMGSPVLKPWCLPLWMVVVIISREFLITGLRLLAASENTVLEAGKLGKHKMLSQSIAIAVILIILALSDQKFPALQNAFESYSFVFSTLVYLLMLVAVFFTVVSGSLYLYENKNLFSEKKA